MAGEGRPERIKYLDANQQRTTTSKITINKMQTLVAIQRVPIITVDNLPILLGDEARNIDFEVTIQLGRVRVLECVATRVADTIHYHLGITPYSTPLLFVAGKGNNHPWLIREYVCIIKKSIRIGLLEINQSIPNILLAIDLHLY
jgi:hypothetical protein